MTEKRVIITSNPLVDTGQAYLFQQLLGKEVVIKEYSKDYVIVQWSKHCKFTITGGGKFYEDITMKSYGEDWKVGEKVVYRQPKDMEECSLGEVVWLNSRLDTATIYDLYHGEYRTITFDINVTKKLTAVQSVNDLLGMKSVFGDYEIVDVSPRERCIRYYDKAEDKYHRVIWYADGGFARFIHTLIKLGFGIDYRPTNTVDVENFEKLFQLAMAHDLDIIQREHMYAYGVVNNNDTIKVAYPMEEYLRQMFNLEINIREVTK